MSPACKFHIFYFFYGFAVFISHAQQHCNILVPFHADFCEAATKFKWQKSAFFKKSKTVIKDRVGKKEKKKSNFLVHIALMDYSVL